MIEKNKDMKMILRILSLCLGFAAMLTAAYFFLEWDAMGFPDGHVTDFQKAVKFPYY